MLRRAAPLLLLLPLAASFSLSPPLLGRPLLGRPLLGRPPRSSLSASRSSAKAERRKSWIEQRGIDPEQAGGLPTALPTVGLVAGDSKATIYPFGGLVASYAKGGQEFVVCRPDAKFDGSKPISGGLSLCWPQFGPPADDNNGIQQHGFARNVDWEVVDKGDDFVTMRLEGSDKTKEFWDVTDFTATLSAELSSTSLSTTLKITNTGEKAFAHQAALHSYFGVSSLANLKVKGGFKGASFIDKMDGGEVKTEEREEIEISEEYDRIYKGVNDPKLVDEGKKTELVISNESGFADTVIWNPYGSESMGFDTFVCVESAMLENTELGAGEVWEGKMVLTPGEM